MPGVETFATVQQHRGEEGVWFQLADRRPDDQKLPPDFYLREPFEVDLDDVDSLAGFVSAWGRFDDPDYRDLIGGGFLQIDTMFDDAYARSWLPEGAIDLHRMKRRLAERLGLSGLDRETKLVHPSEVAFRVRLLRWFAEHVARWQSGPADAVLEWVAFRDHLNAALSVFQVRLDVLGEPGSQSTQQVTGFSAAALQLWNDLDTATYRHCDECGLLFTRQRGRSREYSRTTGVRFHDRTCANRYTQRQYRLRQKAKGQT